MFGWCLTIELVWRSRDVTRPLIPDLSVRATAVEESGMIVPNAMGVSIGQSYDADRALSSGVAQPDASKASPESTIANAITRSTLT